MIGEADLLARFEVVNRLRDDEWMVRCRSHPDERRPSLHVTRRQDRWLLYCFAGCAYDEVREAADLTAEDLGAAPNGREPVAIYVYTDEEGRPLFEVGRFEPKRFLQRRPGRDDWKGGVAGVRRVLYRLPKVIAAIERGAVVYVVEGEKDVHAMERANAVATTMPGGTGGGWRDEYTATLTGANVIVVADNDEPGRAHAADVVRRLTGSARSLRALTPSPAHKDVSEHLRAGLGLDRLEAVEEGARADDTSADDGRTPPSDLAARLQASRVDLVNYVVPAEPPYLPGLERMMERGARALCAAPAKAGKSVAWLVAAVDIVLAGGTVVILDRENGATEYARRLADITAARGCTAADLAALSSRLRYHAWPVLKLSDKATIADAFAGADLVIFDSSRKHTSALGLAEDKSDDYAKFTDAMLDPLARAGIATLVLDNTGWEEKGRPRGSTAKVDLVDVVLILEKVREFDRRHQGLLRLRIRDGRSGSLGGPWEMTIGGGAFGHWKPKTQEEAAVRAAAEAKERFRAACAEVLAERRTLGREPLLTAVRERGLSFGNSQAHEWLADLASDPASGFVHNGLEGRNSGYENPAGNTSAGLRPGSPRKPGRPAPSPKEGAGFGNPAGQADGRVSMTGDELPLASPEEEARIARLKNEEGS